MKKNLLLCRLISHKGEWRRRRRYMKLQLYLFGDDTKNGTNSNYTNIGAIQGESDGSGSYRNMRFYGSDAWRRSSQPFMSIY